MSKLQKFRRPDGFLLALPDIVRKSRQTWHNLRSVIKQATMGRRFGIGGSLAVALVMTSCSAVPKKDADRPTGGENAAKSASVQADGNEQRKTSGTAQDAVTDHNTPRGKSATAVPGQDVPNYPDSHNGTKGSPIKAKTKSDADSTSK